MTIDYNSLNISQISLLNDNEIKEAIDLLKSVSKKRELKINTALYNKNLPLLKELMVLSPSIQIDYKVLKNLVHFDISVSDIPFIDFVYNHVKINSDQNTTKYFIDDLITIILQDEQLYKEIKPKYHNEMEIYFSKFSSSLLEKSSEYVINDVISTFNIDITSSIVNYAVVGNQTSLIQYLFKNKKYNHLFKQEEFNKYMHNWLSSQNRGLEVMEVLLDNCNVDKNINNYLNVSSCVSLNDCELKFLDFLFDKFEWNMDFITNFTDDIASKNQPERWDILLTAISNKPKKFIDEFIKKLPELTDDNNFLNYSKTKSLILYHKIDNNISNISSISIPKHKI